MKFLLDTNIVIPLEPTSPDNVEPTIGFATRLVHLASKVGAKLFLHPAQQQDFRNDRDERRRRLRLALADKYQLLERIDTGELDTLIGEAAQGTNDYVDHQLLAAVHASAVAYLVTEDQKLWRKAKAANLDQRVLSLADAIGILEALLDRPTQLPPAVESVKAYQLDLKDPIWDSFRGDYDGFDKWLDRCRQEHRDAWTIKGDGRLAGVTIVKQENTPEYGLTGKVLKICSFKVSEDQAGFRFGELFLKTIFGYAEANSYEWIYVTAFEKQTRLIQLFQDFGFARVGTSRLGEQVLAKPMAPQTTEALTGLDYNIRFGPFHIDWSVDIYVVPIRPEFDQLLFPDHQYQPALLVGEHPFGNSLRKAYLCHSPLVKMDPGSIVLFYRSTDMMALTAIGVVEQTARNDDADEIASLVAKRTVYSYDQIRDMARKPVLAILFRQSNQISPVIRLQELIDSKVLNAPPQSIVRLKGSAKQWIVNRLAR